MLEDPGLRRFLSDLERLYVEQPGVLDKTRQAIDKLPPGELSDCCAQLRRDGVFPDLELSTDRQVGALWGSALFQAILREVGFFPPPETDLTRELPPPCSSWEEAAARPLRSTLDRQEYWRFSLGRSFSELYLEPALQRMEPPLRGCDLACGWGKGSFSLRCFDQRELYCCDLSESSLELLEQLARTAGLSENLVTVRSDLAQLPFPDDYFDFFIIFDIFEQLTDGTIERMLAEVLRCSKPGAAVYCKIAVHAYCPAATHIQDFTPPGVLALFQSFRSGGKTFRKTCFHPRLPDQYGFRVAKPVGVPRGMGGVRSRG